MHQDKSQSLNLLTNPPILSSTAMQNNQGIIQKILTPTNLHANLNNIKSVASKTSINNRKNYTSKINTNLFHIFDDSGNKLNIDALLKTKEHKKIGQKVWTMNWDAWHKVLENKWKAQIQWSLSASKKFLKTEKLHTPTLFVTTGSCGKSM